MLFFNLIDASIYASSLFGMGSNERSDLGIADRAVSPPRPDYLRAPRAAAVKDDTGGEFGVRFMFAWNSPGIWLDRGSSGPHSPFLPPVVGAATNSPPVSRMAAGHRAF